MKIILNTDLFGKSIFSKNKKLTVILLIYFYLREIMNTNQNNIEESCGLAPDGFSYFDPGNDPNFVFQADTNFEVVTLYDIEGNIANMNSWFECAHYVNGGWSSAQIMNYQGEKYLFFSLLTLAAISSILYFLDTKKRYVKK